jgi:hypothetical protein
LLGVCPRGSPYCKGKSVKGLRKGVGRGVVRGE